MNPIIPGCFIIEALAQHGCAILEVCVKERKWRVTMKVLLVAVNAKYIHTNLAVYSLKAYAKKYSDYIELTEYTINHIEENILKEIYKKNADIVAFSCYIWNIDIITRVVVELKKVLPKVKIWFGGPEVSYDAVKCLKSHKDLDGIMIGEGEQTFLELMEYYVDRSQELNQIFGLAFKNSAKLYPPAGTPSTQEELGDADITITPQRLPLSLDVIPFPYEEVESFHHKIIYYESSRGCPFSCSYCLSSIDKRVRHRDTGLVKKELKIFLDHKVSQVKFVDRTFNCNKKHAMEIWQFVKEQDNGITNFHFEIAADLLDDEEIKLLATLRPGQVQLEIGVQSTNPDTILVIHRKTDFDKISQNVRSIHAGHNIHQHLDLIAGLPLESYNAFSKSFDDVYRLKPDQFQLGFLKVLKGALMEEEAKAYGIVHQNTPPYEVLMTNLLPYSELLRIKGVCEMVEIYYNSGQYEYSIPFLEHFFETPMQLYQELSDYYERNKLDLLAHSRVRRYEILLDFYKEMILNTKRQEEQEFVNVFKEIMVLDLYLREDMKSRPAFAQKPVKFKNIHEIYDKLETDRNDIHIEHFTYDIINSCKAGQAIKKDNFIVFDYSKRNLLNKAAKIMVINNVGENAT